jgi:hypothetical protein
MQAKMERMGLTGLQRLGRERAIGLVQSDFVVKHSVGPAQENLVQK